ncbi:hypothetical protein AKO1_011457, partial [Acrasis kona]
KEKLVVSVLKEHFGDQIESLGRLLIERGPSTLRDIITLSNLELMDARQSLLVLIQHNMVRHLSEEQLKQRNEEQNELSEDKKKDKDFNDDKKKFKTPPKAIDKTEFEVTDLRPQELVDAYIAEKAKREAEKKPPKVRVFYELLMDEVLMLLKTSKFVSLVKTLFGDQGELVLTVLLTQGRLSLHDTIEEALVEHHKRRQEQENDDDDEARNNEWRGGDVDDRTLKRQLREAFNGLVQNRFVKRVDVPVSSQPRKDEEKESKTLLEEMRERKKSKTDYVVDLPEKTKTKKKRKRSVEDEEEKPKKKKKKLKKNASDTEMKDDQDDGEQKKKKKKKKKASDDLAFDEESDEDEDEDAKEQELYKLFDLSAAPLPTDKSTTATTSTEEKDEEEKNVCWTVNTDQFVRYYRNEAIVQFIGNRINNIVGELAKKMISLTSPYERTKNDYISSSITFASIREICSTSDMLSNFSDNKINLYLDMLANDQIKIVQRMANMHQGSFVINLGNISGALKKQYCESIIEQKHGQIGCRIFRILLDKKQLEVKQVAELAMIPPNEARTLLYKMLQSGVVLLQEVPKYADHAPSKTFYLWKVNLTEVYKHLIDDMYKTVNNLRARISKEHKSTLQLIGSGGQKLSEEQTEVVLKLEKAEDRMEISIIRLMELLMFFEDF